jgi:hypothetical protein
LVLVEATPAWVAGISGRIALATNTTLARAPVNGAQVRVIGPPEHSSANDWV